MSVTLRAGLASRRDQCIGSTRFGIEPHEASVEDFPAQPSQKDGLGRMCKLHWNVYTAGLALDAKARKVAAATKAEDPVPEPEPIEAKAPRPGRKAAGPIAENADGATA